MSALLNTGDGADRLFSMWSGIREAKALITANGRHFVPGAVPAILSSTLSIISVVGKLRVSGLRKSG